MINPTMTMEVVTPDLAKEYLNKSAPNRHPREHLVDSYAEIMRRGQWVTNNGSTIVFDNGGHLIDGQHRLMAVIKAKMPIALCVMRGCETGGIDRGTKRTLADEINISGFPVHAKAVAIVNALVSPREGPAHLWTDDDKIGLLKLYKKQIDVILDQCSHHTKYFSNAQLLAVYVRCFIHNPQTIETLKHFIEVVADGIMTLSIDQNAVILRNYLMLRSPSRGEIHRAGELCLGHYLQNRKRHLVRFTGMFEELWPLTYGNHTDF